jgi:hypothetical protein
MTTIETWLHSKHSGVALAIVEPPNFEILGGSVYGAYEDRDYERDWRRMSERRMTDDECRRVIGLLQDGAYVVLGDLKKRLAWCEPEVLAAIDAARVSYPDLAGYLQFECGAEYVRACRIAFSSVAQSNYWRSKRRRQKGDDHAAQRERGWI